MNNFFKKSNLYKFWPGDEFIIPPSSGAVALHALIIIVKHEWKIVKIKNELTKVSEFNFSDRKILKTSFN